MTAEGFTLFDTPLGRCGISWGPAGVTGVQLPESSEAATRARLLRRFPGLPALAPPAQVQAAIEGIVALLSGEPRTFEAIALDMTGVPPFHRRVYELARTIAPGHTRSYGELARLLGEPGASRAVGQALGANPFAPVVPCHRVLAAGQRPGGFSAAGGVATKLRLLQIEGARFGAEPGLFDAPPPGA
ncbi:methylated-DNA--[protein]-cysteine S-methyltransferase [Polaromonas sp.]|uniref:methylated-DNA--[protein]-cysteine S-methyltransferase n=1 Tax=Polaromonas sp. TaxID=1869339 RepID=UPI00286CCD03|nr:methylated-DNA--[protein]-cysteine S-methyltransferase [Polaromonas sp.]